MLMHDVTLRTVGDFFLEKKRRRIKQRGEERVVAAMARQHAMDGDWRYPWNTAAGYIIYRFIALLINILVRRESHRTKPSRYNTPKPWDLPSLRGHGLRRTVYYSR